MTQAPVIQQPSIPSSEPVPTQAYQQAPDQSAQVSYQTPSAPQVQTPQPQVAAPQAADQNPWQEAYNRLTESLSATQSSQPQAAYSTPTPQAPATSSYPSQEQTYQAAPSASGMQTYLPQATPAYSPTPQVQEQSSTTQQNVQGQDGYLGAVSDESLEVIQHFGAEAPALLNRYACVVEDALINQAKETAKSLTQVEKLSKSIEGAKKVVKAAAEDNAAYHVMLTNPDMLSEYVNEFFGPNGPHPVELPQDRLAAEVAANEARTQQAQFAPQPQVAPRASQEAPKQAAQGKQPAFRRPQMDMPAPGTQAAKQGDFWAAFSNLSDKNPAAAWQVLSQASPDQLRSKVLVSEE